MSSRDPANWMLSQAIEQLARAERLHRHFFSLTVASQSKESSWEPPVDVIETDDEILIFVALPGVDPQEVDATIVDSTLQVSGRRSLPVELRSAKIHHMELPQGRFERRIALPIGRFAVNRFAANGCVVLRLSKLA